MNGGADLIGESRIHQLAGIDLENPCAATGCDTHRFALALMRENSVDNCRAVLPGDFGRTIRAAVSHHDDIVAERDPPQAFAQARLVILRADQCR